MKLNMGVADRVIRLIIVAVIVALYFAGKLSGLTLIILGIVAAAFLLTGLIGWCPIYAPFGLSTRKKEG